MKQFSQSFLSPDTGTGSGTDTVPKDVENTSEDTKTSSVEDSSDEQEKFYTEDDIKKMQSDFERQLNEKIAEAAKTAQMPPDEKAAYEQNKRLQEIEKREQEIALRELKADTINALNENDLDKDFLKFVIGNDKDSTLDNIKEFKNLFDKAVQSKVEVRLRGKTPPAGSSSDNSGGIREQIKKSLGF